MLALTHNLKVLEYSDFFLRKHHSESKCKSKIVAQSQDTCLFVHHFRKDTVT